MEPTTEHIEGFEKLMSSKGFDGYFLCNIGHRGSLIESMHQYFEELKEQAFIKPFHLTTYSFWKEDGNIRCGFKIIYDRNSGFKIDKLEAGYFTNHELSPVRTIELRPKMNDDIPTRTKLNSMVGPRQKTNFRL